EFPQDLAVFKNIVHTFQTHLPLENEPNLVKNWDFFYERSIGCVGILKDWLSRTLAAVLQKNADSKTLTLKDFDNHGWSLKQCMVMLAEAREEERQLASTTEREELRAALGLALSKDAPLSPKSSKKKKRKAVGKPSPQRRRVGNAKDVV
ncbi:MAG: AAA family ATPase, partial [Cyanobacteria bacterium P01_A01_bin.17]